jgi:uncharacterized protein YdhG (YjbR/CyaY superfamily)
MANTAFRSVEEYIATFPEETQRVLQQLRRTIRKALPSAEEVVSYKMPAYRLGDRPVVWFAGWKTTYSIYPLTDRLFEELRDELTPFKVNKSTLRFPLSQPVPVKLIERIAKLRAKEDGAGRHAYKGAKREGSANKA